MTSTILSATGKQTVQKVLELLKTNESTPALSQVLEVIQDLSEKSDTIKIQELADAITKDLSLTAKILIAANTVHFNHSGQRITTITEAIQQVGLSKIRNLTITLLFLAPLQDPLKSDEIRNISSIALMSGLISQQIQALTSICSPEQILICSTLRYYGRLLIANFFAEEVQPLDPELEGHHLEEHYRKKLGILPLDLGYQIAASLNLCSPILKSLESTKNTIPSEIIQQPDGEYLIISDFSMSLCDIIESKKLEPEIVGEKIKNLAERFSSVLKIDYKKTQEILLKSQKELEQFEVLYHLPPIQTSFIHHLNCVNQGTGTLNSQNQKQELTTSLDIFVLGLQEITEMLTSEKTTSTQVYQKVIRIIHEALRLRNCAILMSPEESAPFVVQEALGQNAFEFRSDFKINKEARDIFSACTHRGDDVLLQNLTDPKIHQHLPAWFKTINQAGAAFLLPIKDQSRVIGIIYGDKVDIGSIIFSGDTMRNLKALRNQIRIARKVLAL